MQLKERFVITCNFCQCETDPNVTKVFTAINGTVMCIHCLLQANNTLQNDGTKPKNVLAVERKVARTLYLEAHSEHEKKNINEK